MASKASRRRDACEVIQLLKCVSSPVWIRTLAAWQRSLVRAWVEEGVEPPPSCFPSVAEGSLVPPLSAGYPEVPGFAYAGTINGLTLMDHSTIPPKEGAGYPVLVSTVDADGNATAGLRHPVLQVPRATLLGWNLRSEGYAKGDLYSSIGGKIPFAETKAERLTKGGPEAIAATKQWLNELDGSLDDAQLSKGAEISAELIQTEDAQARLRTLFKR